MTPTPNDGGRTGMYSLPLVVMIFAMSSRIGTDNAHNLMHMKPHVVCTDVQGCCWWGRGSMQMGTKGTCLYGKLNDHIGKAKAQRDGEAMFPNVDFCNDPGQICAGFDSIPLKWISGLYHWMENVQKYDRGGFNYKNELVRYVNGGLTNTEFFDGAANIHVLGCHTTDCSSSRSLTDMDARLHAFETVMSLFGLQFESHAEPEPPFRAFPGQQVPTQAPTVFVSEEAENSTLSPISSPTEGNETVVIPFNVFLTGVPNATNMTNDEQILFESIMFDMLALRLETVDITVLDVVTDSQIPNPIVAGSRFDSQSESGAENESGASVEETKPVLQVVMNVTIGYSPPPPEGVRDWSIYVKSWVESFGSTLVEVFTSSKHPQHPETNSKFWDELSDVSSTNVEPPNTDPTQAPTPVPEPVWVYPDTSKNTYIIAGVTLAILFVIVAFCAYFLTKLREYRRLQSSSQQNKAYLQVVDEESRQRQGKKKRHEISSRFNYPDLRGPLQKVVEESSSDSSSSSDSESSSDSDRRQKKTRYRTVRKFAGGGKSQSVSTGISREETASAAARSRGSVANASSFSKRSSRVSVASASSNGKGSTRISVASASSNGKGSTRDSVASASSYVKRSTRDSVSFTKSPIGSVFSNSTYGEEKSGVASAALRAQDHAIDDSGQLNKGNQNELSQFDEMVERIMINDPTLTEIVLDDRKRVQGHHHHSHTLWNALCGNTFVTRLSLRCCNINDQEAESLSLALVDNTCITHVWLGDNDITDEGVECEKHSFTL